MSTEPKTEWVEWTQRIEVPLPPQDLPEEDGVPLESNWHRLAINLLIECLLWHFRDRHDFFTGGNMFVYFSAEQVRNADYRGPDVFFVWNVDRHKPRRYWAIWDEEGKYPDVIVELLSPKTAREDRTTKKAIYEKTFKTSEYFLYDPETQQLEGWRLAAGNVYQAIPLSERGWLWSQQLQLWLGPWQGTYLEFPGIYPRLFTPEGQLVLIGKEDVQQQADAQRQRLEAEQQRAEAERQRAEAERQRAEAERQRAEAEQQRAEAEQQRAEAAEQELTQLKARLAELEQQNSSNPEGGNT